MGSTSRIVGYDLARSFAVLGMVLVNFKVVMGAADQGPDWLVVAAGLLNGRAAATFVVLAGVGVSLMAQGSLAPDRAATRSVLLKRSAFLFVVGLAFTPIWPADILHFYGVYIALASLLLAWSSRAIAVVAMGLVLLFPALLALFDYGTGWDWAALTYTDFWTAEGMLRHLLFNGFHPAIPWTTFLLVGVLLGRLDMRSGAMRKRVFLVASCVALAAEAGSRALLRAAAKALPDDLETLEELGYVLGTTPMPPMPLYMVAAGATAVAMITVAVHVGETCKPASLGGKLVAPLLAAGQLSLTLYVAHVVVGMGVLEWAGKLENQSLGFALSAATLFFVGGVCFSVLWRRKFRRGPIEELMRRVTG